MNYADDYLKVKEHLRDMGDAMLHNRWEEVPTLIKAMRMRMEKLETWAKQRSITWVESQNLAAQSVASLETK